MTSVSAGWVVTMIVVAVVGVFGTIIVALLKNTRASPEKQTAINDGWDKLTGGYERRLATVETALSHAEERLTVSDQRDADTRKKIALMEKKAERQAAAMAKMRDLNLWLTERLEQLAIFIASHELALPAETRPRPDNVTDEDIDGPDDPEGTGS